MKILFAASEAMPFIRTGGLGDVLGSLPKALKKLGHDARVILPLYKDIPAVYRQLLSFKGSTFVDLAWRRQYCGVFEAAYDGITYYFIDNEYYFKRDTLYGHFDDGERYAFFSKAVCEVLRLVEFIPDVLHCNDWQTALVPVFLDVFYRFSEDFQAIKTVYTIHNIEFQGRYSEFLIGDILGLSGEAADLVRFDGGANYMKGGIESAAAVTTVSRTYAREIQFPFYSYGLGSILAARKYKIFGVVNGIDTELYNPQTDKALFQNYGPRSLAKKAENKKGLAELVNLPYSKERPIVSLVSKLTEQKGLELIAAVIDELLALDIEMVALGKGDWKYETLFRDVEKRYPGRFKAIINFNGDLASQIYAGSDIFLMPSKFEPCGLSQMIAMRYGTIPVVRETGGLKDTVEPFDEASGTGTGFTFKNYEGKDMLDAVARAAKAYSDRAVWETIQKNAMKKDFSWNKSAEEYVKIYQNL
ncbi:MAG TPA: glycogen synthase GlgA [Eubacteriales bacterium]|nr:glycogen synthase GlgA [Eubacteriales bacterium]